MYIKISSSVENTQEFDRLNEDGDWKLWGPYLSERQWGTVREDYSDDGNWLVFSLVTSYK